MDHIGHVLGHETHLTIEVIPCLVSNHNGNKEEIISRKIIGKSPNTCRLNNTLLNNTWVKEEISREIEKCFEQ